jgi:hypothetical protein
MYTIVEIQDIKILLLKKNDLNKENTQLSLDNTIYFTFIDVLKYYNLEDVMQDIVTSVMAVQEDNDMIVYSASIFTWCKDVTFNKLGYEEMMCQFYDRLKVHFDRSFGYAPIIIWGNGGPYDVETLYEVDKIYEKYEPMYKGW